MPRTSPSMPTVVVSNNVAYISGTAPVNVTTIEINGAVYPLTWTTFTNWVVTAPLRTGTNVLTVTGINHQRPVDCRRHGQRQRGLPGHQRLASGPGRHQRNHVCAVGAERGSTSNCTTILANTTFRSFRLAVPGLGPIRSPMPRSIAPTNYLVLAANRAAFAAAYGATHPVFDSLAARCNPAGILALVKRTVPNQSEGGRGGL